MMLNIAMEFLIWSWTNNEIICSSIAVPFSTFMVWVSKFYYDIASFPGPLSFSVLLISRFSACNIEKLRGPGDEATMIH